MNREFIKQIHKIHEEENPHAAPHKIHEEENPHAAPHNQIFNINNDHIYIVKYKSKTYALMNPRVIDDELIVDRMREVNT